MNRIKLVILILIVSFQLPAQDKKPVTFVDLMQFKQIKNPIISYSGNWIAYNANPDRGNEEAVIISAEEKIEYRFEKGINPVFSNNEKWAGISLVPDFIKREKEKKKNNIKNDLILVNLELGVLDTLRQIKNYSFSENSNWIAVHYIKEENDSVKSKKDKEESHKDKSIGSNLLLINLNNNYRQIFNWVSEFAFDSLSNYLAYYSADTSGHNGLYIKDLNNAQKQIITADTLTNGYYTHLTWHKEKGLAFLKSAFDEKGNSGNAELYLWNNINLLLASERSGGENWIIPAKNNLHWSKDGERLFFGYKLKNNNNPIDDENDTTENIYDVEKLLSKKEMDVWHWKDPKIKTNEKEDWKNKKDQVFPAVVHINVNKIVKLANPDLPFIQYSNNPKFVFGYSDVPYLIESTWDDEKFDNYIIDLNTGEHTLVASKVRNNGSLSPNGKFLVYYQMKNWFLYNTRNKTVINLTQNFAVPFYNEDHDYPIEVPGYDIAGWIENDEAVLIYDKYDIWKFDTNSGQATNLTNNFGRTNKIQLRVIQTDKDKESFGKDEKLLISAYHDLEKFTAIYSASVNKPGTEKLIDGGKKYKFLSKAENKEVYLYTRESYQEYPDLWICGPAFNNGKKLTDLGSQFNDYKWGKPELVEWSSIDGIKLQGILIKPDNFDPEKKYPVFVYYYRFFTPNMYNFPEIVINHRPKFPVLISENYCVFLPDIRFEIGRPGYSATKCLVPGVQKLIDMGVANPNAIALHGHSWSGYQTAFVITQTNIFKCAIAGAPVSNMTSAYSGIRWGSGKARQFQYEKAQSRIGGSLWEYPERYYENSPVFFADKINTPLLIMHGDIDEAVPWYQSIELYLAMRRLEKDCVFLQYRGEPHHLTKYPNKLDYSIKMKEYLDYHLKGKEPPLWITKGEAYIGN
ncbi:MAG: prolyl oligopeptidase family serine peptidase [Bacteroidetes bacterium]|nr:prolyl oligopeptidase family serine peptidase [Bacteroidota bacterium]